MTRRPIPATIAQIQEQPPRQPQGAGGAWSCSGLAVAAWGLGAEGGSSSSSSSSGGNDIPAAPTAAAEAAAAAAAAQWHVMNRGGLHDGRGRQRPAAAVLVVLAAAGAAAAGAAAAAAAALVVGEGEEERAPLQELDGGVPHLQQSESNSKVIEFKHNHKECSGRGMGWR